MTNQTASPRASSELALATPAQSVPVASVAQSTSTQLPPTTSLIANGTVLIALLTFLGVIASLLAAGNRTKKELAASESRMNKEIAAAAVNATAEREQSRDQAALDRKHDADQAHAERIATSRRTVYLLAAAEVVRAQKFLGALPAQDFEKLDVAVEYGGLIAIVAQIAILGDMDTVTKARALLSEMHLILFRALKLTLPLAEIKHDIKFHQQQYDATQLEIKRIIAAMNNHNEAGKTDRIAFENLNQSFTRQMEEAAKHDKDRAIQQLALLDEQKKYAATLLVEMGPIGRLLDDLLLAIRSELGLETSLTQLNQSSDQMQALARSASEDLFAHLDSKLKQANNEDT